MARVQKLYEPAAVEAVAATGNESDADPDLSDISLDDEVAGPDPFDELIEAADESQDRLAAAAVGTGGTSDRNAQSRAADREPTRPSSFRRRNETRKFPQRWPRCRRSREVKKLFGQLQVRRSDRGNVVIEAPAEAASTLGAPLRGDGGALAGSRSGREVIAYVGRSPRVSVALRSAKGLSFRDRSVASATLLCRHSTAMGGRLVSG